MIRTKTGWEDLDAIFAEANRLTDELKEIQKEAGDIIYADGNKVSDNQLKLRLLSV
jgi:hypothetical protein